VTIYNVLNGILIACLALPALLLLLARADRSGRVRSTLSRWLKRVSGHSDLRALEWWHVTAVVAAGWAAIVGYNLLTGLYNCSGPGHESDIIGFLNQGRALWAGSNPFNVPDCGGTIQEPDGLAAVAINAIGSVGGVAGIAAIWGAISISIVPLTWLAAGPDRRYLTLYVTLLPLYFPLVASQIDGASNALVPATVFLTLVLARRREVGATSLAGFLATQRFPTMFPILGISGSLRRRFAAAFAGIAVFAAGTGLSILVWGHDFLGPVFFNQIERHSFSLNFWGIFLLQGWLPSGEALPIAQGLVTILLVLVVFFTVRSPLRAAAIVLTGVALLTQFLSFNILVWILPAALVGARPRWWLWGIAVVATTNYNLVLGVYAWHQGIYWPTELLDLILTACLLGLFVDLWRIELADRAAAKPEPASGPGPEVPSEPTTS
jgi:hypothetical protein